MQLFELDKTAPFYVAGHSGMVGSAIWRLLEREGFTTLLGRTSKELDLRDRASVFAFFEDFKPRYVVLAAARVGGILANDSKPVEFLSDNLQIQVNVLDAALEQDVERLVFLGSSCIYPKDAPQPLREEYLMTGPLEPTNEAYATAKIAGIKQVQAVRKQFGRHWISVMPTNLYGPGDNYTDGESHVMAALIKRFMEAKRKNLSSVTNWGSGKPFREFLHVDDLAKALVYLLNHYDSPEPINVGSGREVTIRQLSNIIQEAVGYSGRVSWDLDKPDGVFRKLLDTSPELVSLFEIDLESGVRSVVRDLKGKID